MAWHRRVSNFSNQRYIAADIDLDWPAEIRVSPAPQHTRCRIKNMYSFFTDLKFLLPEFRVSVI